MTEAERFKRNAYSKAWRKRNPEYVTRYNAEWRKRHPGEATRRTAQWRVDNPEKAKAGEIAYATKNADKIAAYQKGYRAENKAALRVADRARKSLRYKTDHWFRIRENLRNRINEAITEAGWGKRSRTAGLIGCSWAHLKAHIESLFQPGMSWENYGEWHIDHKLPCKSFNLCELEEQKRCMNWTNLQPLWALDNLRKGAKLLSFLPALTDNLLPRGIEHFSSGSA